MNAIEEISTHHHNWEKDYVYNPSNNEFKYKEENGINHNKERAKNWFKL